jgi:hypothetical protein
MAHILEVVQILLEDIDKATLQAAFLEWMERLRKYIATNGESAD